ncbi:MAG TPA: hypothetical protein VFM24_00430, partial [Nitrospira sp.]|nr:hypothetical protein [Nitrospira sp.]
MPAAGPIKRIDPSPGIQFDQDLRFQERIWRIERVGWLAMAAILFAAVLGLFGRGLLSQASVEVA